MAESEPHCEKIARTLHDGGEKRSWMCVVLDDDFVDFRRIAKYPDDLNKEIRVIRR